MNEHNTSKEGTGKGSALSVEAQGIAPLLSLSAKASRQVSSDPGSPPTSQY